MNNGMAGKMAMWAIGAIFTLVCVIAIPTMAKSVIENDRLSRARDEKLDDRLDKVEVAVTRIDTSLSSLKDNYKEQRVETKEGFQKLEQLIREINT